MDLQLRTLARQRALEVVDINDQVVRLDSASAFAVRAVHAFLFGAGGQLVLQLTGNAHRHPECLGSSVAGFVSKGETYEDAIRRRTSEELGIQPALQPLGKCLIEEAGGAKFVMLYVGSGEGAQPNLPGHVGDLTTMSLSVVKDLVASAPERFTPTFPTMLAYYLKQSE